MSCASPSTFLRGVSARRDIKTPFSLCIGYDLLLLELAVCRKRGRAIEAIERSVFFRSLKDTLGKTKHISVLLVLQHQKKAAQLDSDLFNV